MFFGFYLYLLEYFMCNLHLEVTILNLRKLQVRILESFWCEINKKITKFNYLRNSR